jgi:phenylalanyl-tRNA synthetase beta chain
VFLPRGEDLPDEPRRLAVVLAGRRTPAAYDDPQGIEPAAVDFADLKGIVEGLLASLHIASVAIQPAAPTAYLHPGKSAMLSVGHTPAGVFGELHPSIAAAAGLAGRTIYVADLDAEALFAAIPARVAYRPFSTFPPAKRDIALLVPIDTPAESIRVELTAAGGDLLTAAELFDVYSGDRVPPGTKSLAYALSYQAADRTLSDKEIDKAHQKIEGRLRHVLGAQIRGKDGA